MRSLVERFSTIKIPSITWDFQLLPKNALFRRAIGRHRASLVSKAHWLWFADCDLIFHAGCLDSVAEVCGWSTNWACVPDHEGITDLLPPEHPMLNQSLDERGTVDIDTTLFRRNTITKAKGAFQIVHGDVARAVGYCGSIALYQQPSERWRKTYEDTVFRQVIDYDGEPINVDHLYRIRHAEKGRYAKNSLLSRIRGGIRQARDKTQSE